MNYSDTLKAHLARYKRTVLGVDRDGTWSKNGRAYSHILPKELQDLNLVEPIKSQCLSYMTTNGIKRHADFSHLNSSQAFAFNLFFPWLTDSPESREALLRAFGIGGQLRAWQFEAVLDEDERTNFDLWLDLGVEGQAFIEVKLTESGFGAPKPNERRRRKLDEIYRDRLAGRARPEALAGEVFFKRYQLLRNLSYVDPAKKHILLLVFPGANVGARTEAETFLREAVLERCRPAVRIVHAEDLYRRLQDPGASSPNVRAAMDILGEKYALLTMEA